MTCGAPDRFELHPGDDRYPTQLASSPSPPETLYVMGDPDRLVEGLAIVGSRKATPYGLWAAERFGAFAGGMGVTVISGAAYGCDSLAQRAAIEAGGPSVAVLGCGADVDYPRSSAGLLARLRREGAVVSEKPWGAPPLKYAFRARNRIIACLAKAVLIVEAGLPSGTFLTADFALDAGRIVMAVPGSIRAPESRGTNRLIRQGAAVVTDMSELGDELAALELMPHREDEGKWSHDSVVDGRGHDAIARALVADAMRPDDVAWALGLSVTHVMVELSRLEDSGVVRRYPDGRYGPS